MPAKSLLTEPCAHGMLCRIMLHHAMSVAPCMHECMHACRMGPPQGLCGHSPHQSSPITPRASPRHLFDLQLRRRCVKRTPWAGVEV